MTHTAAQMLGLKGKEVLLKLTKVGNQLEVVNTKEYLLPLTDEKGKVWNIPVFGMEELTSNQPYVDMRRVAEWFNIDPNELNSRPNGCVDVLVGTNWCKLLPNKVDETGDLQLMKNQFGYCIRGYHPLLEIRSDNVNTFQIHLSEGNKIDRGGLGVLSCCRLGDAIQRFMDVECLGSQSLPNCGACKCGMCTLGSNSCTIKEQQELRLISEGLTLNTKRKEWTVKYPWKKPPEMIPNNYFSVFSRLKSSERRLMKGGKKNCEQYNQQIQDMLDRNVARRLTEKEMHQYQGPVHYIPHHEVIKPESVSTPVRIVFNASASFMGHRLNDYWAKGPNVLSDILAIMLRFRQFRVAVVGDIKKMYNTIRLSTLDQHTHRFLWRWLNVQKDPIHYLLLTVTFGDRPSGVIATLALRKTAQLMKDTHPRAADMIERHSYVDDLLKSVESLEEARQVMNEVETVLDSGGFKIKHWILSGESGWKFPVEDSMNINILDSSNEKVLGMSWVPQEDIFKFRISLNFSKRKRNKSAEGNVTAESFHQQLPEILTPRLVISQLAMYDPLGLVSPYILSGKLLMRKTLHKESGDDNAEKWDTPLANDLKEKWITFFEGLFQLENLHFERCLKPKEAVGDPELVVFTDASELAYGACVYVRWQLRDHSFTSRIIMAKHRIAPKRKLTIPRLELCAAVLGSRLQKRIVSEMDYNFSRVFCLTDSMIVRCQIQKDSYGFKMFTATRIGEIQENSEPSEWSWIGSAMNPADMTTRVTNAHGSSSSLWKEGPDFLKNPVEEWPVKKDCYVPSDKLPDKMLVNVMMMEERKTDATHLPNLDVIDLKGFNSYNILINVTAIILCIARISSFKVGGIRHDSECFKVAENEWIKFVQIELGTDWMKRYKRLGPWLNESGLIVVGDRLAEWFKMPWNQHELVLLPSKGRFTYLYAVMIHNEDHTVDTAVAKVRRKYWVPQMMKMMRKIKHKCIECRKRDKKVIEQKMSSLPIERLAPSPPFYVTFLDLFGPIRIKDTVKGRCRGKSYGVIFNCASCRAVYIDVGDGYDTDSFLLVLRRFITIHGYPSKMISDYGSQIVAGAKEMKETMDKWDWSRIERFGKESGLQWEFNKSAEAPWQNGCSESLIRLTKRNLASSIGQNVLNYSELQTVFFEVGNMLNERPIGMKPCEPLENYVCPNDLLLGRSSVKVPAGDFQINARLLRRLHIVEQIVQCFWKIWQQKYFHTLIIRQRWHTAVRDLQKGDVVIIKGRNNPRGKWQMAVVEEAVPGKDGQVRDVTVKYKNLKPGKSYDGSPDILVKRSVHNLVLILPVEEQSL